MIYCSGGLVGSSLAWLECADDPGPAELHFLKARAPINNLNTNTASKFAHFWYDIKFCWEGELEEPLRGRRERDKGKEGEKQDTGTNITISKDFLHEQFLRVQSRSSNIFLP